MNATDADAQRFLDEHVGRIQPLARAANLASWEAATTGKDEAIHRSAEARTAVKKLYSDASDLSLVQAMLDSPEVTDPIIRRQLLLLKHSFTANQLSAEILEDFASREAELEGIFYNFRAELDGALLSNNELRERLDGQRDSARRRKVWEAAKQMGPLVAPRLLELVRRRNAAARDLGFENYYAMELELQEIDQGELDELLDGFRRASDGPFTAIRERLDEALASRYSVSPADLRPWHWDDFFAQEAPAFGELDLDPLFEGFDHEDFVRGYFAEVGLPVDDVLDRSDLYEREGKDQHAFCTDIDREGDIRILCNLRPNERWMGTLLHELGHAVYDKYLPASLPYLLRSPAHILSTEAVAMYFGRLTRDPKWLRAQLPSKPQVVDAEIDERQQLAMLVAARWMLVMVHFERELYRDPERPDLNDLWWTLVEEFQLVRRPDGRDEPDWATKIHLSLAPVYYHNYLLGELMASQITTAIRHRGGDEGAFLRNELFNRGATVTWSDLLRQATGAPLSSDAFVEQFVSA